MDHNRLWEILEEMGKLECFTCLLRNLYVGEEATVRTGYGTMMLCSNCSVTSLGLNTDRKSLDWIEVGD